MDEWGIRFLFCLSLTTGSTANHIAIEPPTVVPIN